MTPLPVPHGEVDAYGFRVGDLGYITDGKRLPPRTLELLRGVRTLVLNALWFGNPHPTHFNVEEAVEAARPRVVVCEYNSIFGAEHPITAPIAASGTALNISPGISHKARATSTGTSGGHPIDRADQPGLCCLR